MKITNAAVATLLVVNGTLGTSQTEIKSLETTPPKNQTEQGAPVPQANNQTAAPVALHKIVLFFFEKGTGVALKRVEIAAGNKILYSDPEGKVEIEITKDSEGVLTASKSEFEPQQITSERLLANTELKIFLWPKLTGDNVVIVKGERKNAVSRKSITIAESRKIAPGGDPAQIVSLLPGVQSQGFGSDIVVRGSGPNDSKYYVDDIEVPFIFHSIGQLSVVPPPLLAEVQFDSGGFGPEYGDATGGVVVLRTTTEIPERPKTEFVLNFPIYSSLYHERPTGEDSFLAISLRRSYIDIILKAALKSREDEMDGGFTVAPRFTDAAIFHFKKDDAGHRKLSLIAAEDGLDLIAPIDEATNEDGTAEFSISTRFVNLGYERLVRLNRQWKLTSTPQVSYLQTENDFDGNQVEFNVTKVRVPTELVKRLSKNEDLYFGMDPEYIRTENNIFSIFPRFEDPTFDIEEAEKEKLNNKASFSTLAAWVAMDKQISSLRLTPGIRGFYNSAIEKSSYDPRLRGSFEVDDKNTLKAAIGQYSKAPEAREAAESIGNPGLDYEKSIHYVAGVETKWNDRWTTETQLFYKNTFDVVSFDFDKKYNNDGRIESKGLELFIRRNLTNNFFGWVSYTYSQSLAQDSKDDDLIPSIYDQTHVLNVVSSYKLSSTWELGGRFNHETGTPYTRNSKAVYNGNLDKYQPRQDEGDRNQARLPDTNSLTLYSTYDFLYNTWKMALKAGLESYWYEPQVIGRQNNYDYSKESNQTGLPAIPFIELRGEF